MPEIEAGRCGNKVIEGDEACDTLAIGGIECRKPGEIGACRFDCSPRSDGSRDKCPNGGGCSLDGACRAPTGKFQLVETLEAAGVGSLLAGDFDGDGRSDVLSQEPSDRFLQSRFQLHYFDAEGHLAETRAFPKAVAGPKLTDLDGDGRSDLLLSDFRIGLLRGRADRNWVGDTFTTYRLPETKLSVIGIHEGFVSAVSGFVTVARIDGTSGIYFADARPRKLSLIAELDGDAELIAGRPAAGDIVEGEASPCQEVVVGLQGASSFSVFELCRPWQPGDFVAGSHHVPWPAWLPQARKQVVDLPAGAVLDDTPPLVTDIDADGHLDVLIGSGARPFLARGDGAGLASKAELYVPALEEIPMPLAAADFTGDGRVDFVLDTGLLVSSTTLQGEPSYALSRPNTAARWTVARIADLNGNGVADVVAASDSGVGVQFFNGTNGPFQVPTTLPTRQPVVDLAVGDFDGDLIGDVAYVARAPTASSENTLELAFGNPAVPPSEPVQVGRLRDAETLTSYREEGFGRLLVTSTVAQRGRRLAALTMLDGGADRLPVAPCALVNFTFDGSINRAGALAYALGAFTEKGASDVMALAAYDFNEQAAFWLLPGIDSGTDPILLTGGLPEGASPRVVVDDTDTIAAEGAAADLDRDGIDESIWLLPVDNGARCVLATYGVDAGERRLLPRRVVALDESCLHATLMTFDLDGDEHVDLLMLKDKNGTQQRLEVWWNDGSGGFDRDASLALPQPEGESARGFALPKSAQSKLIYITNAGVYSTTLTAARSATRPELLREVSDGRAVTVADVNGDGVRDIVVADATGLSVLQAELDER